MKTTLKKRVGIGLLLLGCLLFVALPAVAEEETTDLQASYDAYLAQQELDAALAAIEADKDAFVQELAAKFDLPERVASTLADKDAETLLEISEAANWEEYIGLQLTSELVFYPLTPCRVLDTRFASRWGFNPIPGGGTITIDTWVPWQGGQGGASNCGVISDAAAVVLNVTAVPTVGGDGFLTVWPYGQPRPLASLVNYNGNSTANAIANAVVQTQCRSCAHELNIYAWTTTHVVADVVGYFARPTKTAPDNDTKRTQANVSNNTNFAVWSPACSSGWRLTGGGFISSIYEEPFNFVGSRPVKGTSIALISGVNQADRYLCQGRNQSGGTRQVDCFSICAQMPGR